MLAAILFQSPIVAALLLVICGLLLGYALGTGRMQDSDALASIATWLSSQPRPSTEPVTANATLVHEPQREPLPEVPEPVQLTAMHHTLAIADEERSELLVALESAHEELADLHDDLDSHRRALETIERYRVEAQEELAHEREQSQAVQARLREYEDLASRFDAANDELSELRGHNAYLQSQLIAAQEAHRVAEFEWKSAHGEAHHYHDQVEQVRQQCKALEQEMESVRADRESLLTTLRGAQEQNRQLSQQVGDQEHHARLLQEELDALYVQRAYWEAGDRQLRLDGGHESQVAPPGVDANRVRDLEDLVGTLREQLRLVQLQAQEMVQRHQENAPPNTFDSVMQLERDRRELLERIRQHEEAA